MMAARVQEDKTNVEKAFSEHRKLRIPKNRPLLYQGEIPAAGFYISRGVVKAYNITSQGEEKVVGYESDGSLLPIAWIFGRSQVAMYYYDTYTDCEIIRIPREDLLEIVRHNGVAAAYFLDRNVAMYIGATMHLHALEQSKARQKLLAIMQYLVLRFGKREGSGSKYKINLKLTHQEIANLIGTTRETTSTEIGKLTKEGIISTKDGYYIVDTDKAVRLSGEEDFDGLVL